MTESYVIENGPYRAEVVATGAGLRVLTRDGRALTETWPVGEKPPLSAGLILAPWPNRTRDGRFTFEGDEHQLEITEPAKNNASHGLVRRRDWTLVDHGDSRVEQTIDVGGEPGWPYPLRISVVHALVESGLIVTHSATNTGDTDAPFALGIHAFVRAGDTPLDECTLTVPAGTRLPVDAERNLPQGNSIPVAGTEYDLSSPRSLDGLWLDTPFSALLPDADGITRCRLTAPDAPATVLWTDEKFPWVQVFTADPKNDQAYPDRGRALAIEPMTAPVDALNSGVDLIVLKPGETWTGTWGLGQEWSLRNDQGEQE
ncbi:aldose 1-epimerase [Rhodococcoides trifolii]|uniref:Aldose 1-epimerase n=1 Tax=Rhodococcoides trifolii TaxID=908250 RepID=A0A917G4G4_9NOCA|nr:aldose 1-epimerase family protein [Rhodococcus trifolii]GGG22332.1 aldose 1-epimerase [Rhodococcus trifolii]